jgi:hypothetical protein
MFNEARITIPLRKVLWKNCANLSVQCENIILNKKDLQSTSEKVYGTNPKWISNMRTFGETDIIARHTDKKIRKKLADRGNTVMILIFYNIHGKDVCQFMNIATK